MKNADECTGPNFYRIERLTKPQHATQKDIIEYMYETICSIHSGIQHEKWEDLG